MHRLRITYLCRKTCTLKRDGKKLGSQKSHMQHTAPSHTSNFLPDIWISSKSRCCEYPSKVRASKHHNKLGPIKDNDNKLIYSEIASVSRVDQSIHSML